MRRKPAYLISASLVLAAARKYHCRLLFQVESCMISGSLVALVTPMDSGGGLDWKALERLIDFHLEKGTDGIVAVAGALSG